MRKVASNGEEVSRFIGHALERLVLCFLVVLGLTSAPASHATVRQPNGEYQDAMEDLSVKVLGGKVVVSRTWQADDLNKGQFRWYFNPNWADLQFTYDSIDGSVKQITRSGSQFTKTGTGTFVFDSIYFIKQTATPAGWRWYDPQGNWITYDANGKITGYGDRNNVGVSFTRNADGTINQLKEQSGNVVLTYTYSGGNLSGISDYSGRSVRYQYSNGLLSQVTDALGYNWTYSYTGGLLTGKTDPNGNSTTVTYNGNRVVRITDPMGYQTNYTYAYDHFKRVYTTVETSPTNVRTETHYDANGKLIYQQVGMRVTYTMVKNGANVEIGIDERGLQTSTTYDTNRNPISVTYPDGTSTSATYSTIYSSVTSRTDELGVKTAYQYDGNGNLKQLTEAVGLPEQRISTYTYDQFGQLLTQTVKGMPIPNGVTPGPNDTQYQDVAMTWTYDQYGNVASITDALNHTTSYTYDVMGNLLTKKDPRGNTWTKTYNAKGWLTSQTDSLNHGVAYTYDKVGNRTSATDALNSTTTYGYDADDRKTSVTDPLGGVSTTSYDGSGRMAKECDQTNICTTFGYDADGRQLSTADGAGNIIQAQYGDATNGLAGQVAAMVYPTYTAQYKYDSRGRCIQIVQILTGTNGASEQQITATGYDAKGRSISVTDSQGRTTLTVYDGLDRVVQVTDALSGITRYAHDNLDNLLTVTDAKGNTHRFTYDLANRTTETRPMGEAITYAYDANGNLLTRTSPKGDQRSYSYDAANNRIQETQTPAGSSTISQTVTYTYDARSQLSGYTQTGDTNSSASYSYDAKGQKTKETVTYGSGQSAFSKAIQYDYYPNGLKKFFTYPDGSVVAYSYTPNNMLASVAIPDGSMIQYTGYQWNVPTQVQMAGVVRNITLDSLQRPLEIKAQALGSGTYAAPTGAIVMDYQYTYDTVGNVTKRITEDGEYDYAYDKLDRLTGATPPANLQIGANNSNGILPVEQYTYDGVHNRISSAHQPGAWNYNADNQLLSYGAAAQIQTFSYDANGNTIKQVTGDPNAPINVRTFQYNAAERLTEVDDNGATTGTYQYDPMGRRIRKQAGGQVTWFEYADEGLIAEFQPSGALSRTYGWQPNGIWGADPLWLANVTTSGWVVNTYQNDRLGTSQRATSATGTITWGMINDAFGSANSTAVNTVNELRFPGQYYDVEVRLHYNYFRNYEPTSGRYIESDPVGQEGGVNFYTYVGGMPSAYFDAIGLCAVTGTWIVRPHGEYSIDVCPNGFWFGKCLSLNISSIGVLVNVKGGVVFGVKCDKKCECPEPSSSWEKSGQVDIGAQFTVPVPIPKLCKFIPVRPPALADAKAACYLASAANSVRQVYNLVKVLTDKRVWEVASRLDPNAICQFDALLR